MTTINRETGRGLLLICISLLFGLQALRYPVGTLADSGSGLFPLVVSAALGIVGVCATVRAAYTERVPLQFSVKNIGIIIVSLTAFSVLSQYLNVTVAIIALVFIASIAATSYSVKRNVVLSICLIAIAFAFARLFSLDLKMY